MKVDPVMSMPVPLPESAGRMSPREVWTKLTMAQVVVRGWEVAFLKARGWLPVHEDGTDAQSTLENGDWEFVLWTRGVAGEAPWEQAKAMEFSGDAFVEEQNATGWRRDGRGNEPSLFPGGAP